MKKLFSLAVSATVGLGLVWLFINAGVGFLSLLFDKNSCEDGVLKEVKFIAGFRRGMLHSIYYTPSFIDGEFVVSSAFPTHHIIVSTEKQKDGTFKIKFVKTGNRTYEKTLREHPEILKQAEEILELGRKKFAEVQATACK